MQELGHLAEKQNQFLLLVVKKLRLVMTEQFIIISLCREREGKYHIPVKIQFYDIEHKQQTIEKTVEYQVKN